MAIASAGTLIDVLRQHQLLTTDQLAQLSRLTQGRCGDVRPGSQAPHSKGLADGISGQPVCWRATAGELVIGHYHVIDKLGQGGLSQSSRRATASTAFSGHQNDQARGLRHEEGRAQFLQEVEAMALLDHPNIVQFCDAISGKRPITFAMEYVDGTDLGKVVRLSGALPVDLACEYIRQSANGLQHAFERNLVHRDIKPVNLFLTLEPLSAGKSTFLSQAIDIKTTLQVKPLIKILGLGSGQPAGVPRGARARRRLTSRGIVGTADYLSPEQARNANAVDIRGDIYSLAVRSIICSRAARRFLTGR